MKYTFFIALLLLLFSCDKKETGTPTLKPIVSTTKKPTSFKEPNYNGRVFKKTIPATSGTKSPVVMSGVTKYFYTVLISKIPTVVKENGKPTVSDALKIETSAVSDAVNWDTTFESRILDLYENNAYATYLQEVNRDFFSSAKLQGIIANDTSKVVFRKVYFFNKKKDAVESLNRVESDLIHYDPSKQIP